MADQPIAFPTVFQPPLLGIKAQVVVKEMYDTTGDVWPDRFEAVPQRGDIIQSETGRRLGVLDVVHGFLNGNPLLTIEIGTDHNNNTATGGGGGDLL